MRAHRRWAATFLVLSLLLLLVAPPLAAQTVDEIIKRGKVIVGVNTTTPIFGLVGTDGQPEGYDPDVARLVGQVSGRPGRVRAGHRRRTASVPADQPRST